METVCTAVLALHPITVDHPKRGSITSRPGDVLLTVWEQGTPVDQYLADVEEIERARAAAADAGAAANELVARDGAADGEG